MSAGLIPGDNMILATYNRYAAVITFFIYVTETGINFLMQL